MAVIAIPAVLRGDTAAVVIGVVEIRGLLGSSHAIDVAVGASAVERVRDRLYDSFAAIRVDDVTEGSACDGRRRQAVASKRKSKLGES